MLATLRRLTLTALRSPHKPCTLPLLLPMYRYPHRTVATSAATSTITATSQPRRKATNSPGLKRSRSTSSAPRTPRRAPSSASASATTSSSSKLHTRSRAVSQVREPEPYEQDEGNDDDDDDDDDEIIVAEQEPSATTERQPRDPSTLPKLEPGTRRWTVRAYDSSIRLDRFVRRALPELGLSLVYQLVRSRKQVTVVPNQQSSTPESLALLASRDRGQYRLQTGDVVTIEISEAQSRKANELAAAPVSGVRSRVCASSPKVLELKRSLVYEDSHLMIFNKPPGLAVQGKSNSIDVVSMLPFLGPDPEHPPKLVHRLDRDTSGLLVLAKTKLAAARMGELLRSRDSVEKRYLAILTRVPLPKKGRIEMALGKRKDSNGYEVVVALESDEKDGKSSATEYATVGFAGSYALVLLAPETGRTHQLRVHCATGLKAPILGDFKYGGAAPRELLDTLVHKSSIARQMFLHSYSLSFPHPFVKKQVSVKAPLPPHMKTVLKALGLSFVPSSSSSP